MVYAELSQEEMCVENKNVVFGTFLAPVWPYDLEIARCKTSVNLLKGGSQEEMCVQCLSTDGRTNGTKHYSPQTIRNGWGLITRDHSAMIWTFFMVLVAYT